MPDGPTFQAEPARVLGPIDATCIVIGGIIGVGIFFNPSRIVQVTGSGGMAMLAWALGGVIAMCGALAFAELGARYSGNGAHYQVLRDSYGRLPAFLYVFCNATAIQPGVIAIIALVSARNLAIVAGVGTLDSLRETLLATALIVALVAANVIGVKWGSRIQNLTVYAKLLALVAIIGLAVFLRPDTVSAAAPPAATQGPVGAILTALVAAFFSYGGWQHALWITGEVREPRRNVPRAIIVGVLICIAVYLAANWAYLALLGAGGVASSKALAADAVAAALPGVGTRVIAAAVAVSAFGVLNAQLLSGPRLVWGMARDGRFFAPFAGLSPRFGTPIASILLLGVIALGLLWAANLDLLLNGVMTIDGVFLGLTGAAVLVLRRRSAPEPGSFQVPLFPLVPAVFVVGELGVVCGTFLDPAVRNSAYVAAVWIAAAAVLYLVRFRRAETPAV